MIFLNLRFLFLKLIIFFFRTTDQQTQMPNNHTEPDDPGDKGKEVESKKQLNLIDI